MEAILACHPARSTEWLECHPKSCELWRIRTRPIVYMHGLQVSRRQSTDVCWPAPFFFIVFCRYSFDGDVGQFSAKWLAFLAMWWDVHLFKSQPTCVQCTPCRIQQSIMIELARQACVAEIQGMRSPVSAMQRTGKRNGRWGKLRICQLMLSPWQPRMMTGRFGCKRTSQKSCLINFSQVCLDQLHDEAPSTWPALVARSAFSQTGKMLLTEFYQNSYTLG